MIDNDEQAWRLAGLAAKILAGATAASPMRTMETVTRTEARQAVRVADLVMEEAITRVKVRAGEWENDEQE